MKGKLGLLLLALCACSTKEKYVDLSATSIGKSVMIEVEADVTRTFLVFDENGNGRFEERTVRGRLLGAGVLVSGTGDILTVRHLFEAKNIYSVSVTNSFGTVLVATITAISQRDDLALIKVKARTPNYATVAKDLLIGQEVIAVGNPLGMPFSVTHGIVSQIHRDFDFAYNTTQSDTSINPGNSGGPLFNLQGELVGINSFLIPPVSAPIWTGLGFSVSPVQMADFLEHNKIGKKEGFWRALGRLL